MIYLPNPELSAPAPPVWQWPFSAPHPSRPGAFRRQPPPQKQEENKQEQEEEEAEEQEEQKEEEQKLFGENFGMLGINSHPIFPWLFDFAQSA